MTFQQLGAATIEERLLRMLIHSDGVATGEDTDSVHHMRVASRRLRAAISVFEPAFGSSDFDKFEQDVKFVTDSLGEARDLDVMLLELQELTLQIPESDRSILEEVIDAKIEMRRMMQKRVRIALERTAKKDLPGRWVKIEASEIVSVKAEEVSLEETAKDI